MAVERNDKYASGYPRESEPYSFVETNISGQAVSSGTISGDCELVYFSDGKWALLQVLVANVMYGGNTLLLAPVDDAPPTIADHARKQIRDKAIGAAPDRRDDKEGR